MDPASIKAFKDLEFLKAQLQNLKALSHDGFTDSQPLATSNSRVAGSNAPVMSSAAQQFNSREERLRELVLDLHHAPELRSADKRNLSLGELLQETSKADAFVYTSGKQQKADYKISARDLAKKSEELQATVRGFADSLEKINELETEVFRHKRSNKTREQNEHPKTRMKVIWDDSNVSPLKLDSYRTR